MIKNTDERLKKLSNKIKLQYGEEYVTKAFNSTTYGTNSLDRILAKK